jgi:hypothetical protein
VGEAYVLEDLLYPRACLAGRHTVELRAVEQVLHSRHLLEEARLDADPVHAPLHLLRVPHGVNAEDLHRAGVGYDERRDHAHERALPAAVRPEDADHLAPPDRERDRVEGVHDLAPPFVEALPYVA